MIINFIGYGFNIDFHGCRSRKISIALQEIAEHWMHRHEGRILMDQYICRFRARYSRVADSKDDATTTGHKFSFVPARTERYNIASLFSATWT